MRAMLVVPKIKCSSFELKGDTGHPHADFVRDCYTSRQIMESIQSWQMIVTVRKDNEPKGQSKVHHSCILDRQLNARQSTW